MTKKKIEKLLREVRVLEVVEQWVMGEVYHLYFDNQGCLNLHLLVLL